MCTLSVFRLANETIITMNRDEDRGREETNEIHQQDGIFYPVDKEAGGTWFGYNEHGTVMALLNRYQDKQIDTNNSRGLIIPALLKSHNISVDLDKLLQKTFNPFDLIIINHIQIIRCCWNGKELSISTKSYPFFISSSSIKPRRVLNFRTRKFFDFDAASGRNILTDLHLFQDINNPSSSIFMSRDITHTKSISQLCLKSESLNYHYFTEKNLAKINKKDPYQQCQNLSLEIPS